MKLKPPGEAYACAWPFKPGSSAACFARTSLRMERKWWFSRNELGVGGMDFELPMARVSAGGLVSRRVRRYSLGC